MQSRNLPAKDLVLDRPRAWAIGDVAVRTAAAAAQRGHWHSFIVARFIVATLPTTAVMGAGANTALLTTTAAAMAATAAAMAATATAAAAMTATAT
ncbi:MAG: hypothetical protein KIS63_16430, partial [Caldilineales bacterium]|nr:hypothetical protein [Caldilineales bacterium]